MCIQCHAAHMPLCLVFVPTAASLSVHACAVHTGGVVADEELYSLAVCVLYWGLLICLMCVRSSKEADTLYNVVVLLSSINIVTVCIVLVYVHLYTKP